MSQPPRAFAARALHAIAHGGKSASDLLAGPDQVAEADRPLAKELVLGSCRYYFRLDAIARQLLAKPLKNKDLDVHCLLLIGLYQLLYTRVPPHAALSETVNATRALKKPWAKNLINGVLRNFQRNQDRLLGQADQDPATRTAHPDWLYQRLAQAWPARLEDIVDANNARAPMTLRVNLATTTREQFLQALDTEGLPASAHAAVATAVVLDQPAPVSSLPGFADGRVSVQDAAAQLAAPLLAPAAGERVLDACAAPGGKSAHLLESVAGKLALVCVEKDPQRSERITETLERLGYDAEVISADALDPEWRQGRRFDRILLDAPCSATGVIRRHPDIKLLRRNSDIDTLVALQAQLLDSLWRDLEPGGTLLYATCSILPEENRQQIEAFLTRTSDARESMIDLGLDGTDDTGPGLQILPGQMDMDGFYYARLVKQALDDDKKL